MVSSKSPAARLGDCLRALSALRPTDFWAGAAVVQLLDPTRRVAGLASQASEAIAPGSRDDRDEDDPADAAPLGPRPLLVASDGQPPPERAAALEQVSLAHEAAPSWLSEVATLHVPERVANPYAADRTPLFEPKLQRAILTRLGATWQSSGALDMVAVLRRIATGRPLRIVPRRRVATTRKGVRLLVDEAESMQPFQHDTTDLVRAFRRVVGASNLRVEGFLGLPSRDVRVGMDWRPYRSGSVGMGLVLITDLGLPPQPLMASRTGLVEWQQFFTSEARRGNSPMVVVPRDAGSLPGGLRRPARLLPWGRRVGVRGLVATGHAVVDDLHGAATDGFADTSDPLAAIDPATLRLATACALAVRVEPPLLRALRTRLLPDSGAEVEARLWFSPLVSDRAGTGLVFDALARERLLQRLRDEPGLAAEAWDTVSQAHAQAAPALRAEELACHHWLRGDAAGAREVLRSMVATVVDPGRTGAWRWASQAVARLPQALRGVEEARMFAMGVALRSGEGQLLHGLHPQGGGAWHWLRPAGRELEIAVTLREGMIEFAPVTAHSTMRLHVPDATAVLIEIHPIDPPAEARPARINPRLRTLFPVEGDGFELQVVGGERYRLRARLDKPAEPPPGPKFASRNRAPRVRIDYERETADIVEKVQLPFVMGVLADLSGQPAEPLRMVNERRFVDVDADNFEARMRELQPRVVLRIDGRSPDLPPLAVDLQFERMRDFEPDAIARRIDSLAPLLDTRMQLANLLIFMDGRTAAEALVGRMLGDRPLMARVAAAPDVSTDDEWASLLVAAFEPRTAEARQSVEQALMALARLAMATTPPEPGAEVDVVLRIEALISGLDRQLSGPLDAVLHHPDFQRLESAWRGLAHLVNHTETDELLKIRFLDISKAELERTLRRYKGTGWDQSPLFKIIYEEPFGAFGGEPFGCLVGDYHFDHRPSDVELLTEMAHIAAAAHAPFIAGAAPGLMQLAGWQQLASVRDLTRPMATPEYAAWRALRESDDARYLALAMPRMLARLPYGATDHPADGFDFEEDTSGGGGEGYAWVNSAFGMAVNITRAFNDYGWCARIRGIETGGGTVAGLPIHAFPNDEGGIEPKCPTEIAISDRREAELARAGLLPLVYIKKSDFAVVFSAQSLHRPPEYSDPDATANASLASRLPYLFASSRFVHYLKCIVRDKIGSFTDREGMEHWLNAWLATYINPDANSSETTRARYPLAEGNIVVEDVEGNPGYFQARIFLKPHYQLEGLTISMRTVTQLPNARSA